MSELASQPAVIAMTLEITRAATGETETVELVCIPQPEPEQPKEQ